MIKQIRVLKWISAMGLLLIMQTQLFAQNKKPNIILIMADDVSWEAFGCYGAEEYNTPHIDKMADEGVKLENCYSTPICTPSRVMIMTGKYNFRNYTHFGYLNPEEKTFGHLMQDAGYKTAIAGKWQLNGLYNNLPDFDDNRRPHKAGFDEYCLWQVTKDKKQGERFWNPLLEQNGKVLSKNDNKGKYGPDIMSGFVLDFMEENAQKKQPFFVYYPSVLVHSPFVPTPKDFDYQTPSKEMMAKHKDKKANFQSMVNYMDEIVGSIIAKTEALGIAENTIIMFTADNGTNKAITSMWNGMQIKGGKGGMTDMGTHVPFVAYWKGHFKGGTVIKNPVDFTDIYPTLADFAGIELDNTDPIDGISLTAQFMGQEGPVREVAVCHYQPYWNQAPGQFVRTSDYKLYNDGRFYQPKSDLKEQNNKAKNLSSQEEKRTLKKLQDEMAKMPLAETEIKGRNATERPIYPEWQLIHQAID